MKFTGPLHLRTDPLIWITILQARAQHSTGKMNAGVVLVAPVQQRTDPLIWITMLQTRAQHSIGNMDAGIVLVAALP